MQTINNRPVPASIGIDNGIGDIFFAQVKCDDGTTACVTIYAGNMQRIGSLLDIYQINDRVIEIS
jgi:hypothetical protein